MEYGRNCPYCDERFEARRINQKFCTPRCKYTHNNRKRDKRNQVSKRVNKLIRMNYTILENLLEQQGEGRAEIPLEQLKGRGFNFTYHTHDTELKDKSKATSYYDIGLTLAGKVCTVIRLKSVA